jgi:hypothetical protein
MVPRCQLKQRRRLETYRRDNGRRIDYDCKWTTCNFCEVGLPVGVVLFVYTSWSKESECEVYNEIPPCRTTCNETVRLCFEVFRVVIQLSQQWLYSKEVWFFPQYAFKLRGHRSLKGTIYVNMAFELYLVGSIFDTVYPSGTT